MKALSPVLLAGSLLSSLVLYGANAAIVVYSFCSQGDWTDGAYPRACPINVAGTLYATTDDGESNGRGTVFSLDPTSRAETVLHFFGSGADAPIPELT